MSSATTAIKRFIAPYVASMDASGAASHVYVQQETVNIAGIDYEFTSALGEAASIQLLNAFTRTGKAVDGNLNVTLSDSNAFQSVLRSVINGANQATNGGQNATSQLVIDLHNGLLEAIKGDALINTVQNVDFTDVSVTIDASSGTIDMATNMTDERCTLIYNQIPWGGRVGVYQDSSENAITSALPLVGGDVLTFVFDVDLSDVVPAKSQVDITTSADPDDVITGQVAGKYTSSLHYNLATKRIAFNIRINGDSGDQLALKA
jgi:hypothetical protein